MSFTADTLALAVAETCGELRELADLLVNINLAKYDEDAVQRLVLDALTRVEMCKIILSLEASALDRRLISRSERPIDAGAPRLH